MEDKPVISSSPLKTASSASPATRSSLAGALNAYLSKYCDVMTGGRVVFQGMHNYIGSDSGWFRFKCNSCHDNWNMKSDLFSNATSSPKELTDWLVNHKHICNKYAPAVGRGLPAPCSSCGWAWNQHKAAQPQFDVETGQWTVPDGMIAPYQGRTRTTGTRECVVCHKEINVASGVGICQVCFKAAKQVHETKVTKAIVTEGRMFRTRTEKEGDRCELQKTT